MKQILVPKTIRLIEAVMRPFVQEGLISLKEEKLILSNLRHLAREGVLIPPIIPKLISQKEVAAMLGLSFGNFRKLEKEGAFPFKRRMIHSAVRFRNTEVIEYILTLGDE